MRILLAEDEKDLNKIITQKLSADGYSVDSCFDGEEAIEYLNSADYDAVILDIMMPKVDGFAVLRHLRQQKKDTPVLFLTARDAVSDRVKGLDSGADDYLVKPFHIPELLARIRALTRRPAEIRQEKSFCFSDLSFAPSERILSCGTNSLLLTAKESELLSVFISHPCTLFSREQLISKIWGTDADIMSGNVDNYISFLRKRFREIGSCCEIKTVYGAGYKLEKKNAE